MGTDPSNAAFDPCQVITWDDFPQKVAWPDRRPPQPQPPPPNALYRVGCLWVSRGSATKDPQTGQEHHTGVSIVVIYWGTAPPLSTLPADHPGGVAKTYAGRPGVELGGTMQTGERKCTAMMPVEPKPGVAGISVAYSDPAVDPCAVATAVLQAIAKVVPKPTSHPLAAKDNTMHPRDVGHQPHQHDPDRTSQPGEFPPNNGNQWTVPPPPRPPKRSPDWLLVSIVVLAAHVGVTFVLLLTHQRREASQTDQSGQTGAPAPSSGFDRANPTSPPAGEVSASPATAPTGVEYGRNQPAVGDCVDTSRNSTGEVVLYRADCDASTTPLVLDRVVSSDQRCEPHGYASLQGFDGTIMCFAWTVRNGDCLDLEGPRKTPCDAGHPPDYGTVTVTDIRVGASDGTGCTDPNRWLQAGAGPTRGVACFMPTSMVYPDGTAHPTR